MNSTNNEPRPSLQDTGSAILLRLWLSVRAIQTGIEKYAGSDVGRQPIKVDGNVYSSDLTAVTSSNKAYALDNYHGIPSSLQSAFAKEPLMADWMLKIYDAILGPSLIILGMLILLGVASRISLIALGLLYISLTWGLVLLKQDAGIAWLGIHIILVVMALQKTQHDPFRLLKKW
ncbi:hypothetical protein [Persicirhabdus sediminis]|uniref:Uncharacterized protein n=1 Tax=Persicirhabdus sediminis TaxID=454144 RepID=A0A8J7MGJ5_9BACT|nr:hypothetical protein [Persicirhabdus sediminis]MBK1792436.1 hypothetical protein [Persicirhabdus sediminis]